MRAFTPLTITVIVINGVTIIIIIIIIIITREKINIKNSVLDYIRYI